MIKVTFKKNIKNKDLLNSKVNRKPKVKSKIKACMIKESFFTVGIYREGFSIEILISKMGLTIAQPYMLHF